MAGQSKTVDEVQADREKDFLATVQRGGFLLGLSVTLLVPARGPLIFKLMKGDATATARLLGLMSTCAAAVELLLNPVLGRLSDKYGRKPFIVGSSLLASFMHSLVAINPGSIALSFINRCISGAMIFAWLNPVNVAVQDTFKDIAKSGQATGQLGAACGIGFALGPLVGSKLEPRAAFAVSSASFLALAAYMSQNFTETLPVDNRKEFSLSESNPLSFLQLFKNKTMSTLALVCGVTAMAEYANIYDINFLFLKTVMGFGSEEIGRFAAMFGFTQICGGLLTKQVIGAFGSQTHTLLSHMGYALGFGLLGCASSPMQIPPALLFLTFGHQRMAEARALLGKHGAAAGMGRGEILGGEANFVAVLKMIAPFLYTRLFTVGTTGGRKVPGAPYFLIAIFMILSQALISTIPGRGAVKDKAKA